MVWNYFVSFPSLTEFAVGAFKDVMLEVYTKEPRSFIDYEYSEHCRGAGAANPWDYPEWQAREVRGVCVRDGGEITEEDRDVGRSLWVHEWTDLIFLTLQKIKHFMSWR